VSQIDTIPNYSAFGLDPGSLLEQRGEQAFAGGHIRLIGELGEALLQQSAQFAWQLTPPAFFVPGR
jgi:hypothetical protein